MLKNAFLGKSTSFLFQQVIRLDLLISFLGKMNRIQSYIPFSVIPLRQSVSDLIRTGDLATISSGKIASHIHIVPFFLQGNMTTHQISRPFHITAKDKEVGDFDR